MISKKLSFDLDQAKPSSSIRLKVTIKNVNQCQILICKKMGQLFYSFLAPTLRSHSRFLLGLFWQIFFFLIHDVQNYIHLLQRDFF